MNYASVPVINVNDLDIKQYINTIMPMILPEDSSQEEQVKVRKLLTTVTSLNVYMESFRSLYGKAEVNVQQLMNEFWFALDNISPQTRPQNLLLNPENFSRYSGKQWKNGKEANSILNPIMLTKTYIQRLKRKIPEKNFLTSVLTRPQVQTALTLRDIFYNGGTMESFDFSDRDFAEIESFTSQLRWDLQNCMRPYNDWPPYIRSFGPQRESQYVIVSDYLSKFLSKTKLRAYVLADKEEIKAKRENRAEAAEFERVSNLILDLCETHFVNLPKNPKQHQEYIKKLIIIMDKEILQTQKLERTNATQYTKFLMQTYETYMEQLKAGKIPLKLSYYPEDKELYASIVRNAKESQDYKRHMYETRKKEGLNISDDGKVLLVFGGLMTAALGGVIAYDANAIPSLITTAISAASAAGIHKVFQYRRLYMDVEKRFSIKNRKVLPYFIDRYLHPEKYNFEDRDIIQESASPQGWNMDLEAAYRELQRYPVEFTEIPHYYLDTEHGIRVKHNAPNMQQNIHNADTPSPVQRHRRSDKYGIDN